MKITKIEGRRQKAEDRRRETEARNLFSVVSPPSSVSRRRGIALIWTAILLGVLILFVGLALDAARLFLVATQLHNAADAGALAGAEVIKFDQPGARALAIDTAGLNYADALSVFLRHSIQPESFHISNRIATHEDYAPYDVLIGRWVRQERTFYPTLDAPNAVMALSRREGLTAEGPLIALLLMPLAKIYDPCFADHVPLWRYAIAKSDGTTGAGLIALGDYPAFPSPSRSPTGLYISGTASLDVQNGGIQVNSTSTIKQSPALYVGGGAEIDAGEINIVGASEPDPDTLKGAGDWVDIFTSKTGDYHSASVNPGEDPIGDPVATTMQIREETLPEIPTYRILDTINDNWVAANPGELMPGYYPGGISISQGTSLTLSPGFYFLGGGDGTPVSGLVMTGGYLEGEGVTLYVTKSTSGVYGTININGGELHISPPGDTYTVDPFTGIPGPVTDGILGISIWQDPTNPNFVHINGNGSMTDIQGTLYFPESYVRLEGDCAKAGNQILGGAFEVLGRATITVNYDGRNMFKAYKAVLVQ